MTKALIVSVAAMSFALGGNAEAQSASACTPDELAALMLVDTILLTRTEYDVADGDPAEGSSIMRFDDGASPRLVRIIDYGETGRADTRVFLRDTLTFVIWRTEYTYNAPLTSQARWPEVVAESHSIVVLCNGSVMSPTGIPIDSMLARLRPIMQVSKR